LAQVVEREGPLRKAKALLERLRRRDLYKYVDHVQVPLEALQAGMCAAPAGAGRIPGCQGRRACMCLARACRRLVLRPPS